MRGFVTRIWAERSLSLAIVIGDWPSLVWETGPSGWLDWVAAIITTIEHDRTSDSKREARFARILRAGRTGYAMAAKWVAAIELVSYYDIWQIP